MELYDIFVLVVAAVLLYFLYRIFSPIIRGLIGMFKAGKRMVDNHNAKKAAQNAPQEQYDEEEYDEEREPGVVYEDPDMVAELLDNTSLREGIADHLIHCHNEIWNYLSTNFNAKKGTKLIVGMALLVQIIDEYALGDSDEVVNAFHGTLKAKSSDFDNMLIFWPNVWKVFMQVKPTEDEPGKGAAMLLVRVFSTITGPGIFEELYTYAGVAVNNMIEQCDELWEKA